MRDLRYVCAGTISPIYLFYRISVSTAVQYMKETISGK